MKVYAVLSKLVTAQQSASLVLEASQHLEVKRRANLEVVVDKQLLIAMVAQASQW